MTFFSFLNSMLFSLSAVSSVGSSLSQRPSSSGNASEALNVPINPQHRAAQDGNLPPVGRQKGMLNPGLVCCIEVFLIPSCKHSGL